MTKSTTATVAKALFGITKISQNTIFFNLRFLSRSRGHIIHSGCAPPTFFLFVLATLPHDSTCISSHFITLDASGGCGGVHAASSNLVILSAATLVAKDQFPLNL
jgi:hypothetical protein